jgi:MFS family permease
LLIFVGVLTGPAYDAGYFNHLAWTGLFLVVFGYMMLSFCTQYWQVMLAQGLAVGFGTACLFIPSVAILPQYFLKKRALANGIAASGSSMGKSHIPSYLQVLMF